MVYIIISMVFYLIIVSGIMYHMVSTDTFDGEYLMAALGLVFIISGLWPLTMPTLAVLGIAWRLGMLKRGDK